MRTEEQILQDFEELGYSIMFQNHIWLELERNDDEYIRMFKGDETYTSSVVLGMQEHKLLTELFNLWGWL